MVAVDLLDDDALIDLRPRARRTDPAGVAAEERRLRAPPLPPANQALRDWEGDGAPAPPPRAAPEGLCAACGTRPARAACPGCGRGACAADLWTMLGLCKRCAPQGG